MNTLTVTAVNALPSWTGQQTTPPVRVEFIPASEKTTSAKLCATCSIEQRVYKDQPPFEYPDEAVRANAGSALRAGARWVLQASMGTAACATPATVARSMRRWWLAGDWCGSRRREAIRGAYDCPEPPGGRGRSPWCGADGTRT